MVKKFKIKADDEVVVIAGRDKGKKGKVLKILTSKDRVVVSGVNMVKKHKRADQSGAGGIVEQEAALHISNVALVDPKEGTATRVGYRIMEDGSKVRFAKKSDEVVNA